MLPKLRTDQMIGEHSHFRMNPVTFTADDLDRTIAQYRRINAGEKNLARVINETVDEFERDFGRLPLGGQGPHGSIDRSRATLYCFAHLVRVPDTSSTFKTTKEWIDTDGTVLSGPEEARVQAVTAAGEMLREPSVLERKRMADVGD